MSDRPGGPPLLVTGMPRTATSWVGKMLEASGALVYVNEPMNPQHPPGRSPGVLRAEVAHAFQYISEENEDGWLPAFRDTVRLRFHPLAELRRNHRPYDLARAVKYTAGFALGRLRGRRVLLDDPYAVFAAPWLARRVGCRVVVTVRDPVATVSSWRRLGWTPRLGELLAQPALVRDRLARFAPDLEAAAAGSGDRAGGVGPASLLWRVIYATVVGYRAEVPAWRWSATRTCRPTRCRPSRTSTGGSGCCSGPGPRRPSGPRPPPGRAAVRCAGRCRRVGCPRRPPAASTAGPPPGVRERLSEDEAARIRELTADVAPLFGYSPGGGA